MLINTFRCGQISQFPHDGACVALYRLEYFPHTHAAIDACGSDACAIRRPGQSSYVTKVIAISVDVATVKSIPDLYSLIIAARGDTLTIG
jgi:hypothetical protein